MGPRTDWQFGPRFVTHIELMWAGPSRPAMVRTRRPAIDVVEVLTKGQKEEWEELPPPRIEPAAMRPGEKCVVSSEFRTRANQVRGLNQTLLVNYTTNGLRLRCR